MELCNRSKRTSMHPIPQRVLTCRSSFSPPVTWIFRQLLERKVTRSKSTRSNLIRKVLRTSAPVVPSSGKVSATIQSENLDLKRLFDDLGVKAMTSGTVDAKLDADGTIGDLNARLDLQVRGLRDEYWPNMEPATFELSAQAAQDRLTVSGKLQQARIQPAEINASMPFDIPKIARARKVPDDTPVTARAHIPRSSVNFIRQFVP